MGFDSIYMHITHLYFLYCPFKVNSSHVKLLAIIKVIFGYYTFIYFRMSNKYNYLHIDIVCHF